MAGEVFIFSEVFQCDVRDFYPITYICIAVIVKECVSRPENKDDYFLLWHDLENERKALCDAIAGCKAVYGSQDDDEADKVIADFKDGRLKYLAAKPEMLGEGLNFQYHCHKAIRFIDYRFNDKFQAIARIYRFMQQHPVDLYLVYAESEGEIYKSFMHKWAQHREMVAKMTGIVRENGLFGLQAEEKMMRWMFASREEKPGKLWRAINNDNVLECQKMDNNSVDLIVTSIVWAIQKCARTARRWVSVVRNMCFFSVSCLPIPHELMQICL
nr:hypothetical protein [Bacteroides helcogenes]